MDNLSWNKSGVFISKNIVAKILNDEANDPHYGGVYRPVNSPFSFRQEVRSEKAPDLGCDQIACNPNFGECDPHWNCEGRGCPSDCAWYDAGCHAWKPVCEGLKAAEQSGCKLDKTRFRAQCNVQKQAEKTECEARKAGCNVNQQWLRTWSESQIGLAEVQGNVKRLAVGFEVKSFHVDPDLKTFAVASTFQANASVESSVKFTPRDLGNLACVGQWSGVMSGEVHMAPSEFTVRSTIRRSENAKDDIQLTFASDQLPVKIKFAPPPFQAVLDHNPQLYIQCAGGVLAKLTGAGTNDTFDYIVAGREISAKIPSTDTILFGTTIYLKPNWNSDTRSIRYRVTSPRWKLADAS